MSEARSQRSGAGNDRQTAAMFIAGLVAYHRDVDPPDRQRR